MRVFVFEHLWWSPFKRHLKSCYEAIQMKESSFFFSFSFFISFHYSTTCSIFRIRLILRDTFCHSFIVSKFDYTKALLFQRPNFFSSWTCHIKVSSPCFKMNNQSLQKELNIEAWQTHEWLRSFYFCKFHGTPYWRIKQRRI